MYWAVLDSTGLDWAAVGFDWLGWSLVRWFRWSNDPGDPGGLGGPGGSGGPCGQDDQHR